MKVYQRILALLPLALVRALVTPIRPLRAFGRNEKSGVFSAAFVVSSERSQGGTENWQQGAAE
jgi:hypothetical protein